ncbi:MAG: T9SS type A sorting domain-containing protein, partial [Bacteroidota bacterium]
GYIIAGHTLSFGAGNVDVYLIKTNADGDTIWTKTFGGTNEDKGYSVQQTTDGGYIIAGHTYSFGAGYTDVYLIKTNADGDTVWTKTFGGTSFDYGNSVQQTTDGGYIIAGYTMSFGAGNWDVYLIKTSAQGNTLWTKTFGGIYCDRGYSVQQTTDGGYIIAGDKWWSFATGDFDVYLIKTNTQGDVVSVKETKIEQNGLIIFPNPANDKIEITGLKNGIIEIINLQGQIIKILNLSNTKTIDISKLSGGVYTMKIKTDNGIIVKKLIKQ